MAQRLEQYATYIWQLQPRKPEYRIHLCMYGINAPFWVFEITYSSPKYAIIGLSNITDADVKETSDTGVFVSYTPKQLTIENDL